MILIHFLLIACSPFSHVVVHSSTSVKANATKPTSAAPGAPKPTLIETLTQDYGIYVAAAAVAISAAAIAVSVLRKN
ncbi:unnamed protein product [Aphanomyces euteiches]